MPAADVIGGTLKGGMSGAALGPEGAIAGAGIGLATGLLQEYKANKLKKAADSAYPGLTDPMQAGFLSELEQKRRSIETGSAFQSGMNTINDQNADTNAAIVKSTGGDVGSTIQSLLQASRGAANAKNQVLAQGQQNQMGYDQMYGSLLNQISARKLQLQMQRSQQNLAEWSKMKQGANQNTQAGIAGFTPSILDKINTPGGQTDAAAGTGTAENLSSMNPGVLPTSDISNVALAAV